MATTEAILARMLRDPKYARQMNEGMADMEFQTAIAPNLGYEGPIDTSKARYHGMPGVNDTTLQGFRVPEDAETGEMYRGTVDGEHINVPQEPGTVNTLGNHADPLTWSHEYRHEQRPDMSEGRNRILDGFYAQDASEWDTAVDSWQNYQNARYERKRSREEAEKELLSEIAVQNDGRSPLRESGRRYAAQKAGERMSVPEQDMGFGNLFDILLLEEDEFAQGDKKGKYWNYIAEKLREKD